MLEPGEILISRIGPEIGSPTDRPYLGEVAEYLGRRVDGTHCVRTLNRTTHVLGEPPLGHEIQFDYSSDEELLEVWEPRPHP